MDAPFTLEPAPRRRDPDGRRSAAHPRSGGLRELRDGIDAAVARGAAGGQGPVSEFGVGDAAVTVSAVPGGSVKLRIDR